ncbi:MAG: hypothetical protein ACRCVX_00645 [Shewanella sp.]
MSTDFKNPRTSGRGVVNEQQRPTDLDLAARAAKLQGWERSPSLFVEGETYESGEDWSYFVIEYNPCQDFEQFARLLLWARKNDITIDCMPALVQSFAYKNKIGALLSIVDFVVERDDQDSPFRAEVEAIVLAGEALKASDE